MSDNFWRINFGIRLLPQGSTPSNALNGDLYYDTSANRFVGRVNGAWDNIVHASTSATLINKTIDADSNTISNIDNNEIKAAAGIVYSKLNLTGSIVNADISASAAIAYSKLNLSNSIVNADINTSAAIAFSKLASLTSANILVGSAGNVATAVAVTGDIGIDNAGVTAIQAGVIVNADVNASAAIAYSKLNLAGSIVNADVNASAAIAGTKISPDFGSQNIVTTGNLSLGSYEDLAQIATPSNPSAGRNRIYFKNDGNLYRLDSSGVETVFATGAGSGDINNGGNSFSAPITIGTNDAFDLNFETNNTTRLTIDDDGRIYQGTISSNAIFGINPTAAQNPLTGTVQRAYRSTMESTTAATARTGGYSSAATTTASAYTTAVRVHFEATNAPNGAGSTITRDIGFETPSVFYGTNNAAIADNEAFTGNWFINSTSTSSSRLSGSLGVGGDPNANGMVSVTGNTLTGTTQGAFQASFTANSSATSSMAGLRVEVATAAAAFTMSAACGINIQAMTKGAGSTITRAIDILAVEQTVGTNNAVIADNISFSGNYFINSTSTSPTLLSGALTVNTSSACTIGATGSSATHATNGRWMNFISDINADAGILIQNLNTGSSANTEIDLQSSATTAGDPKVRFGITGSGAVFALGMDNSDSDKFKISANGLLGTNDVFISDGSLTLITGGTSNTDTFAVYRYANAGDGTGAVRARIGNSGTTSGYGRIEYTNAAASGAPTFHIFHTPRNNADSSNTDCVALKMYKVAASNGGEFELQTATSGGTLTNAIAVSSAQIVTIGPPGATSEVHQFNGGATFTFNSGSNRVVTAQNTDTSAGGIIWDTVVGGTAAGDPYQRFTVTGGLNWSAGIDNSDGDKYKISQSTVLGSNDVFVLDSNLEPFFPGHTTTASAANAVLTAGTGRLQRSTSSLRYKEEVVDMNSEVDSSKVYDLKPISFTDKTSKTRHFGLAAEQVAEVLPELATFAPETILDKNGDPNKQVPDGVQYQLLSVLLLEEVKKLRAELEELKKKI